MEEQEKRERGFNRSGIEIQKKSTLLTQAKLEASYVSESLAMF